MSSIIWTSAANARILTFDTNERMRLGTVYAGGDGEVQQQNEDNVNQDRDGREKVRFSNGVAAAALSVLQGKHVEVLEIEFLAAIQKADELVLLGIEANLDDERLRTVVAGQVVNGSFDGVQSEADAI